MQIPVSLPEWLMSAAAGIAGVFYLLRLVLRRCIPGLSEDAAISSRALRRLRGELRKWRAPAGPGDPGKPEKGVAARRVGQRP
ncbi:hypothetical protein ACIQ9P_08705 [Kitasatospora sp. NPDC094019]|uniref:hypothetical protein n=1 Tax=Kitasatospora sp. NPDC094019 TaxID=3364091 RepID=UPI0037FEBE3C